MKAQLRTRAQKRDAKRGRPAVDEPCREPNGRASRSGIHHQPADSTALASRAKHLGLTLVQAKDQRAETFIGYLAIIGDDDGLSETQYQAAQDYLALRSDYLQSKCAPGAKYDNEGKGGGGDFVSDEYVQWCEDVHGAYMACREAIQRSQNETRECNLWAALDLCVEKGLHLHHMIGDVRLLCNALAKFFKRG